MNEPGELRVGKTLSDGEMFHSNFIARWNDDINAKLAVVDIVKVSIFQVSKGSERENLGNPHIGLAALNGNTFVSAW